MLTDQVFMQPLKTIIGPELFYKENPLQMNVSNAQQFQRLICPSAMFQFYYVAFKDSKKFGDQVEYVNSLRDYGVAMTEVLIDRPWSVEESTMVEQLGHSVDIVYPTEVFKALGIRGRNEYTNGASRFVNALHTQVAITAAWDWDSFIEF